MNTWDHLAEQAHRLLTQPRRGDLTPAVTLVQSLHKQPPQSPAAICAHLETATTALPQLARYARSGDRLLSFARVRTKDSTSRATGRPWGRDLNSFGRFPGGAIQGARRGARVQRFP